MDIYVGNLSYSTADNDLRALFETYGQVTSARVMMDKISGQSRGFGFVEMPNKNEAENAIQKLDGQDFMGRGLRVNESRPKPPREGGAGGGGGGGYRGDRGGDRGGGDRGGDRGDRRPPRRDRDQGGW